MSQIPPQPPQYPYQPSDQYQQPPTTQPPQRQRKPRRWPWIIALVIKIPRKTPGFRHGDISGVPLPG